MSERSKIATISVDSLTELNDRLAKIRAGWFGTNKRSGKTYAPTEHDKIKMNINLYMGQMAQFMFEDMEKSYAMVLDSDDLGSSSVLKAFGFSTKNIHVPNYFKGSTEYETMKERVKDLSAFPVSVDDYVQAYASSKSTKKFRSQLVEKFEETSFYKIPTLVKPYPTRPRGFNFIYLDYCGAFQWKDRRRKGVVYNVDTVNRIFDNKFLDTNLPSVFAITGSLFMIEKNDYDKELRRYKRKVENFAIENGYTIRVDQYFVYSRKPQSGRSDESIGYERDEDIPEDVPQNLKRGMVMFFMSFVINCPQDKLKRWDSLFAKCGNGTCKLEIKHKECLYQRGEEEDEQIYLKKPFCNYKITDFYLFIKDVKRENLSDMIKRYTSLPWDYDIEDIPDQIIAANTRRSPYFDKNILKLFRGRGGGENELLDISELISIVNENRNKQELKDDNNQTEVEKDGKTTVFRLDDVFYIKYPEFESVSVELVIDDLVGIHFNNEPDLGVSMDINESCIIFHKDDLIDIVPEMVWVLWDKYYLAYIISETPEKATVYFPSDNTKETVKKKRILRKGSIYNGKEITAILDNGVEIDGKVKKPVFKQSSKLKL